MSYGGHTMGYMLIIAGNKGVAQFIALQTMDAGYDVRIALSGEEGLNMLQEDKDKVDGILLELYLGSYPGMTGTDFLAALAAHYPAGVPVVGTTEGEYTLSWPVGDP